MVGPHQLLLSSASAGVILEGTFGKLNVKKINYTAAILQTWRDRFTDDYTR